jgi:hypothetical protein
MYSTVLVCLLHLVCGLHRQLEMISPAEPPHNQLPSSVTKRSSSSVACCAHHDDRQRGDHAVINRGA